MKFKRLFVILSTTVFVFLVVVAPKIIFGAGPALDSSLSPDGALAPFIPLVGIPNFDASNISTIQFGTYINILYRLAISIAALLAVVKIVFAGAKYMLSDIVTHKEDAKKDIQGALVGLLIIIGAVLILNTVNTDITKNTILIPRSNVDTKNYYDAAIQDFANRLNQASNECQSKTDQYTACQTDVKQFTHQINKPSCDAQGGTFIPGTSLVVGAISDATGIGQSSPDRCIFPDFKPNIPNTKELSCSCTARTDATTGIYYPFGICFAYDCSAQVAQCKTDTNAAPVATLNYKILCGLSPNELTTEQTNCYTHGKWDGTSCVALSSTEKLFPQPNLNFDLYPANDSGAVSELNQMCNDAYPGFKFDFTNKICVK